jgi:hypothetical protein
MMRDNAITCVQNASCKRKLPDDVKRPRPPDFSRQEHEGVGTAVDIVGASEHAQFQQQTLAWDAKKNSYARVLQSRQDKAALFKGASESPCQRSADSAVGVEKDPADRRPTSFSVS